MKEKYSTLPHFDFQGELLAANDIDMSFLSPYMHYPCKTRTAVFALCLSGEARVSIFLNEYTVTAGNLLLLFPESVIQLISVSKDTRISFMALSSSFVENYHFIKRISDFNTGFFTSHVIEMPSEKTAVFRDLFSSLIRFNNSRNHSAAPSQALQSSIDLLLAIIAEIQKPQTEQIVKPVSREQEILGEFIQLAFQHYALHHHIGFYADKVGLSKSHFCAVVRKASGQTAQDVIMNLIILDAKSQLKRTSLPICKIGLSLGFENPTIFSRYFRKYVGKTPSEYRDS